jgi:uncharacterized protein (DUF58 family)
MTAPRPTRRGVASAALGAALAVAGLQWRYAGVLGLGVALLVLVTVAVLSVVRPSPVSVRRTVWPMEVTRFEPCEGTVRVRRRRALWSLPVEAVDRISGEAVPIALPSVGRDGTAEVRYEIPTVRRGVLLIGPLEVRRTALAGLARSTATMGGTLQVRVLPRVLPVRGLPSGIRRGQAEADERAERGGTDLVALREYLPGDDLRRLHWATSARRGSLMVREDADPVTAHVTLLLDDRAASYADDGLEEAVEVAASLAVAAANDGHPVRLLTIGGRVDRMVTDATALAEVAAHDGTADPPASPLSARDVVVVITGSAAVLGPLLAEAGRATVGIALVVDDAGPPVVIAAPVTVLRGRDSVALLSRWDATVVRP